MSSSSVELGLRLRLCRCAFRSVVGSVGRFELKCRCKCSTNAKDSKMRPFDVFDINGFMYRTFLTEEEYKLTEGSEYTRSIHYTNVLIT